VVVIVLEKAVEEIKEKPLDALKKQIQDELQKEKTTKEIQTIAVALLFSGKLKLTTGSKEQAQTAYNSKRWINVLRKEAKAREAL
jgi:hypothetical protein